jgi:DNA gyrase/topoisomerase IV subunit A
VDETPFDEPFDEAAWEAQKLAQRREIVDGLLWATRHASEILAIVLEGPTALDARRRLTEPPFGFSETVAIHVLDMQLRRLTPAEIETLRAEADELRAQSGRVDPHRSV